MQVQIILLNNFQTDINENSWGAEHPLGCLKF